MKGARDAIRTETIVIKLHQRKQHRISIQDEKFTCAAASDGWTKLRRFSFKSSGMK